MSRQAAAPSRAGHDLDATPAEHDDARACDVFAVVGCARSKDASGADAVLLARADDDGWRYVGRVGGDAAELRPLLAALLREGRSTPTVRVGGIDPLLRGACWVEPAHVIEVGFRGVGRFGWLREAQFVRRRPECHASALRRRTAAQPSAQAAPMRRDATQVIYPDRGITRQQIAEHYRATMDWLLPGLRGRPLALLQCPAGIGGRCSFERRPRTAFAHVRLWNDAIGSADWVYVDDADAVLELVQFGAVEFHPWGTTVAAPERADRVVFELAPQPTLAWKRLVTGARRVCELLERLALRSFLRTTGDSALQVVVPLRPAEPWPMVDAFARDFVQSLAQADPQEFVAGADDGGDGRVRVDYACNRPGATAIASYSLRARPGAPVAVPLRWDELGRIGRSDRFDIEALRRRLARLDADPWEGIDRVEQDLRRLSAGPVP